MPGRHGTGRRHDLPLGDLALGDHRHPGGTEDTRRASTRELNGAKAGEDGKLECAEVVWTLNHFGLSLSQKIIALEFQWDFERISSRYQAGDQEKRVRRGSSRPTSGTARGKIRH
jgi:hypothetical protein